jgi:hypothetical protein
MALTIGGRGVAQLGERVCFGSRRSAVRIRPPRQPQVRGHIPASSLNPRDARDILGRFTEALHGRGLVGEDRTAQLMYLCLTSRLFPEPVSSVVKGQSSVGKSYTIDQVLAFFPEEAYLEFTAMSEHALVYDKRDFAHRTIVIFEAVALREQREKSESNLTAYFVRSLLSEGRIRYPVTQKNKDGEFVTRVIEKNGGLRPSSGRHHSTLRSPLGATA